MASKSLDRNLNPKFSVGFFVLRLRWKNLRCSFCEYSPKVCTAGSTPFFVTVFRYIPILIFTVMSLLSSCCSHPNHEVIRIFSNLMLFFQGGWHRNISPWNKSVLFSYTIIFHSNFWSNLKLSMLWFQNVYDPKSVLNNHLWTFWIRLPMFAENT